jgi:hypothetical protein
MNFWRLLFKYANIIQTLSDVFTQDVALAPSPPYHALHNEIVNYLANQQLSVFFLQKQFVII